MILRRINLEVTRGFQMSGSDSSIADDARKAADDARGGSSDTGGAGGSSEGGSAGSGGSGGSGSGASGSRGSEGSSATAQGQDGDRDERIRRSCKTCPEWRYEMGIRKLGGIPFVYSWHHLFLVQWNRGGTGGTMMTYSAFPSGQGDAGIAGPIFGAMQSDSSKGVDENHPDAGADAEADDMGYLQFQPFMNYWRSGEYAPDNRFVTLRDTHEDLRNKLMEQGWEIDGRRIRYVPTGPNSNSFAMSLAERVGLPRRKPSGDAPGSGMSV